jgi:hypothetical protein
LKSNSSVVSEVLNRFKISYLVSIFPRNLAARLMDRFVIYSPIADDLWTPQADSAGNAIDRATPLHLISAHPRFYLETAIISHSKEFIDIVGIQSGEGWLNDTYKDESHRPWSQMLAGSNAIQWPLTLYQLTPLKPIINQEGPYDRIIFEISMRLPNAILCY